MIAWSGCIRAFIAIHGLAIVVFGWLLLDALAHGSGIPVGHFVLCSHWISRLRKAASGSQIICGSLQQFCMVYSSAEATRSIRTLLAAS
jgi:hypothetical protein